MKTFSRILLKLSGEALAGGRGYGLDPAAVDSVCRQVRDIRAAGVTVGIVVGGGNIFRGLSESARGMDRVRADQMGMLATVINGLALEDAFERAGVPARLMTAVPMGDAGEPFGVARALDHLVGGRVVICSGGTGNPFFSTDTAAALRAAQFGAEALFKATKVDGVYEGDPVENPSYRRFEEISFDEVLARGLRVMDAAAVAVCRENHIPIVVFNLTVEGNLLRAVGGEPVGTMVREEQHG